MQIENAFTVAVPRDRLWDFLLDVERIAPCMPGAELTEVVDDRTWKGKVNMKLGPVSLAFAGTVTMDERDDASHSVKLTAKGLEQKGKGAANASITSWLEPDGDETAVKMVADIQLSGAVAQLSRGLLPEVSKRLTQQFADCLRDTIVADEAATPGATSAAATTSATAEAATSAPAPETAHGTTGASEVAAEAAATMPASARPRTPPTPPPSAGVAPAIGGIRLGLAALWSSLVNLVRRLFGRRSR